MTGSIQFVFLLNRRQPKPAELCSTNSCLSIKPRAPRDCTKMFSSGWKTPFNMINLKAKLKHKLVKGTTSDGLLLKETAEEFRSALGIAPVSSDGECPSDLLSGASAADVRSQFPVGTSMLMIIF